MALKVDQKITRIIRKTKNVFTSSDPENSLNDARKIGEAISKALIINKLGESNGNALISGEKNFKGTPLQKNKKLDFNGLIEEIRRSDASYPIIIPDKKSREKIVNYLESIRIHGNSASHDPDKPSDEVKERELYYIQEALRQLLSWFFQEHLQVKIPQQIKQYIENKTSLIFDEKLTPLQQFQETLRGWLTALGYEFGNLSTESGENFQLEIKLQERRKTINILIYGIVDEIKVKHYHEVNLLKNHHDCDEGWIITTSKVSKAVTELTANNKTGDVLCYNLDELIEQDIDLSKYFTWVEEEITKKSIHQRFIHIGCEKVEIDDKTKSFVAKNRYTADDGFTEGYLNVWLSDKQKEHISILGEFGTGKTWLTLHYTWLLIKEYKNAKAKKLPRPRLPILIHLRDFAKAINVDSLISDFFFRKHQIDIKGAFAAFQQLNKMGKLILIFDGFDEMADKINKQKMIDNFWELASIINQNSKIILTCRTEHFPQIKEGRSLLQAELKDSTKHLTGKTPQFEVLQLSKLDKSQIRKILSYYTDKKTIDAIFKNTSIIDLLERPIMSELIIDALKDIEEGKPIDLSRIYLYAIRRKMERDIDQSRTFTSLADKLYFMCELSWEMLAHDKLKIHFKEFHGLTDQLFGYKIEERELDYWRYDMRGQTILTIDEEDGFYKPAHKSFLEFFAAFKFAAELGVLSEDFLEITQKQSHINESIFPIDYKWSEYFTRKITKNKEIELIPQLNKFLPESIEHLSQTVGKQLFTRIILNLLCDMINLDQPETQEILSNTINKCKGKKFEDVNYLVSNIVLLLVSHKPDFFKNKDLSFLCLRCFEFPEINRNELNKYSNFADFSGTNFKHSDLQDANFKFSFYSKYIANLTKTNFNFANLNKFHFQHSQIDDLLINESEGIIYLSSHSNIIRLDTKELKVISRAYDTAWHMGNIFEENLLVHSGYGDFRIRNAQTLELISIHEISKQKNPNASEPDNLWTGRFGYINSTKTIVAGCNNSFIYFYSIESKKETKILECFFGVDEISLSSDEKFMVSSGFHEFILWDLPMGKKIIFEKNKTKSLIKYNAKFHPKENTFILTNEKEVIFYNAETLECDFKIPFNGANKIAFSGDGEKICVSNGKTIILIAFNEKNILKTFNIDDIKSKPNISESPTDSWLRSTRINRIILNKAGSIVYFSTEHNELICFDLTIETVSGSYTHLIEFTDATFINTNGINEETLQQLYKNGAIINSKTR
jgi:ABC-type dipeptide/oligopeptide/nickel transport system ATPase component